MVLTVEISPELREALEKQVEYRDSFDNIQVDYDFIKKFMPLTCVKCNEPFATFDESHKHFREKHKCAGSWQCCEITFETVAELVVHMDYHRNPDIYKYLRQMSMIEISFCIFFNINPFFRCSACERMHHTHFKLRSHIYHRHLVGVNYRRFHCKYCPKVFSEHNKIYHHERRHIKTECPFCESENNACNLGNLSNHIERSHLNLRKVVCVKCGKVLCDEKAYKLHYLVEHSGIDQRLQCDICKLWYGIEIDCIFSFY